MPGCCPWYGPFHTRPVAILLIRKPDRSEGFDVAIASTDVDATSSELIARYDSLWTIETAHQEAKAHGVGQAQPRPQGRRTHSPLRLPRADDHIAWYAPHGDPDADLANRRRSATLVPPEGHDQLRRHARRPAPRAHPPRISGTAERLGHNRTCLSIARKLLKRSYHTLRELAEEALQPA